MILVLSYMRGRVPDMHKVMDICKKYEVRTLSVVHDGPEPLMGFGSERNATIFSRAAHSGKLGLGCGVWIPHWVGAGFLL